MSVLDKRQDIEQITDALLYDALGSRQFVHAVCNDLNAFSANVEDYKGIIYAWANRLYIANQIAYILTYSHNDDCDMTIVQLNDTNHLNHGGYLMKDIARWYRMLESIKYNLFSNGGQVMLCREDMERLDTLMSVLSREIVGMYQKEKGKVK